MGTTALPSPPAWPGGGAAAWWTAELQHFPAEQSGYLADSGGVGVVVVLGTAAAAGFPVPAGPAGASQQRGSQCRAGSPPPPASCTAGTLAGDTANLGTGRGTGGTATAREQWSGRGWNGGNSGCSEGGLGVWRVRRGAARRMNHCLLFKQFRQSLSEIFRLQCSDQGPAPPLAGTVPNCVSSVFQTLAGQQLPGRGSTLQCCGEMNAPGRGSR